MKYTVRQPLTRLSSKLPVLLILHGYGADEFDLLPIASQLDPSFLTISIQAPIKLSWGGYAWYNLTQTPTGLRGDIPGRIMAEEQLYNELPGIILNGGGDPRNVYFLGFSQGAAMCYSLLERYDFFQIGLTIRAVMILSGFIPEDIKEPLSRSNLSDIPFFLSHGTRDELIPPLAMYDAQKILEAAGAKTFTKEYETGHGLTEETVSDIRNWLSRLLQN